MIGLDTSVIECKYFNEMYKVYNVSYTNLSTNINYSEERVIIFNTDLN